MFFSSNKGKLEILDSGLRQLESKQKSLVEENEYLKSENLKLKNEVVILNKELSYYQGKIEASKIVDLFDKDQGSSSELLSKIDEYILAIDSCINLLEKQS